MMWNTSGLPGGASGKEGEGEVTQSCLTLCDPMDCGAARAGRRRDLGFGFP